MKAWLVAKTFFRKLIVILTILLSISYAFPPVMAAPAEGIPRVIQDFLEGAVFEFKTDQIRSYDTHPSGMICLEYGNRHRNLKFKFDDQFKLLECKNSFYDELEDSFDLLQDITPISQLPLKVSNTIRNLFPGIELINYINLVKKGSQLYQIHGLDEDVSVYPIISKFGELIQFSLDRDGDGLGDAYELVCGLDHLDSDSDRDGFPDGLEHANKGDATNPKIGPKILKMNHDAEAGVMVITVKTCKGKAFLIEANPTGEKDKWQPLGEAVVGNGEELEFNMPDNDFFSNVMVRVGIENAPKLGVRKSPDKPRRKSNKCNVPLHLKGKEIIVGQGKRLVFRNARRGELIEGGALGNMVTPFSYTFTRPEHCKGKLVLTFSNRDGFETVIYQLTFVNKGGSGAYIANKFDQGKKESAGQGVFTISMN